MVGILIALQINNWNEQRKEQNRLQNIYSLIYIDMENDKKQLIKNLEYNNQQQPVFNKVLHDSITPELLDQGLSRLLGGSSRTILNKTGVNQLRELQNKDSLTLKIINIYDVMENRMLNLENRISNEITDHSEYVRDHFEWYPEWINNTIMQDVGSYELHNYFLNDKVYRNRVISVYQQTYNNYVPLLNTTLESLTNLQDELKGILNKTK